MKNDLEDAMTSRRTTLWAAAFALTFPSFLVWLEFVVLAGSGESNLWQQAIYAVGKGIQFGFPIAFLWWTGRGWPRIQRPVTAGVPLGLAFGVVVTLAMFGLYFFVLRGTEVFGHAPERIRAKLAELGLDTPMAFFWLAVFICIAHSLLEEVYWRWFVHGRLREVLPAVPATALSSLGFAAHHVIILNAYLPGQFWSAVIPFSLCVAVGGAFWAWLYDRTGSLLGPWAGHLLIDAGIFVVGFDLLSRTGLFTA